MSVNLTVIACVQECRLQRLQHDRSVKEMSRHRVAAALCSSTAATDAVLPSIVVCARSTSASLSAVPSHEELSLEQLIRRCADQTVADRRFRSCRLHSTLRSAGVLFRVPDCVDVAHVNGQHSICRLIGICSVKVGARHSAVERGGCFVICFVFVFPPAQWEGMKERHVFVELQQLMPDHSVVVDADLRASSCLLLRRSTVRLVPLSPFAGFSIVQRLPVFPYDPDNHECDIFILNTWVRTLSGSAAAPLLSTTEAIPITRPLPTLILPPASPATTGNPQHLPDDARNVDDGDDDGERDIPADVEAVELDNVVDLNVAALLVDGDADVVELFVPLLDEDE